MAIQAKSAAIRLNVTPAMQAALVGLAEKRDVSVAQIVREAVRDYLAATPNPK